MRTLLLNNKTGLYLQGIQRWTQNPELAFDFKLVERALRFIEIWRLEDVELAFAFNDSQPQPANLQQDFNCSRNPALEPSSV